MQLKYILNRQGFYFAPMNIRWKLRKFVQNVVSYVVHVPLKVFTSLTLFEKQLFRNVAVIEQSREWLSRVKEFFVFLIEPRLDDTFVIL